MSTVEEATEAAKKEIAQLTNLLHSVRLARDSLDNSFPPKEDFDLQQVEGDINQLIDLIKLREILVIFRDVGQIDHEISSQLKNTTSQTAETDAKILAAAESFVQLANIYKKVQKICPAGNLLRVYVQTAHDHWNKVLYDLLSKKFDKICQEINWVPISGQESTSEKPVTAVFDHFFQALLKIDTSSEEEPCLPIVLLVKHLEKRFYYHFMRPSRTNQLSKPEWYFTQVLNWIKESEKFVESNITPILRVQTYVSIKLPARSQMSICLLKLLRIKLVNDLDELVKDDVLFSHCYDELLAFVRELESLLGEEFAPVHKSVNLFDLFTQEPYFGKLMRLEKKQSTEYIESILHSPDAWLCLTETLSLEHEQDRKIPQIADQFVLLLQAVIDRTCYISETGHKQAYVLLIVDLIDDLRLRLSQLVRELSSDDLSDLPVQAVEQDSFIFPVKFYAIMNTLSYVRQVIEEWQMLPSSFASDFNSTALLQDSSLVLQHLLTEMESKLIDAFEDNLRVHFDRYSDLRWKNFDEEMEQVSLVESSLLLFISRSLSSIKRRLSKNLAELIASIMAKKVNRLFVEIVVFQNKFNNEAAARIRNLVRRQFPILFKSVLSNPNVFLAE